MNRDIVVLGLIGCVGCLPNPEPVHWEAFDVDALRDALANPTAAVTEATITEAAANVAAGQAAFRELGTFIADTFLSLAGDASGHGVIPQAIPQAHWVIPQALDGTSVYAMLACPGEDPGAIGLFEHGYMRLDSPTLTQELIESRSFGGDLQLEFFDCEIGQFSYVGAVPAHFDVERLEVGLNPENVRYRDLVKGEDGMLSSRSLIGLEQTQQLLTLESGGTLSLISQPFILTLQLVGTNGTLVCVIIDDEFVCTPP